MSHHLHIIIYELSWMKDWCLVHCLCIIVVQNVSVLRFVQDLSTILYSFFYKYQIMKLSWAFHCFFVLHSGTILCNNQFFRCLVPRLDLQYRYQLYVPGYHGVQTKVSHSFSHNVCLFSGLHCCWASLPWLFSNNPSPLQKETQN